MAVRNLKAIRRRIVSIRSTQQITRAMRMVSAAKLRRAQNSVLNARPMARALSRVLFDVAARADTAYPLLEGRTERRKALLLVIASDRGLCGGFNSNINRRAWRFLQENRGRYEEVRVAAIGRKAVEFLRRRNVALAHTFPEVFHDLTFETSRHVARTLMEEFLGGGADEVFLLYNQFKSAMAQEVVVERLLPVAREPAATTSGGRVDFLYEPGRVALLDHLVPRHVAVQVHQAILESVAAEHAARMAAMEAATRNAAELLGRLTLEYNRARQATITKELMEIVGGAEAMKK